MAQLDREFEFYRINKESLLSKYENKFIVIVGHEIIGVFDNEMEAINNTRKTHQLGTFFVQHVIEDDEDHFYSPIFPQNAKSV